MILTEMRDVILKTLTTKSCVSFIYADDDTTALHTGCSQQTLVIFWTGQGRVLRIWNQFGGFWLFPFELSSKGADDTTICITLIPQACLGIAYIILCLSIIMSVANDLR